MRSVIIPLVCALALLGGCATFAHKPYWNDNGAPKPDRALGAGIQFTLDHYDPALPTVPVSKHEGVRATMRQRFAETFPGSREIKGPPKSGLVVAHYVRPSAQPTDGGDFTDARAVWAGLTIGTLTLIPYWGSSSYDLVFVVYKDGVRKQEFSYPVTVTHVVWIGSLLLMPLHAAIPNAASEERAVFRQFAFDAMPLMLGSGPVAHLGRRR